jgi:hypothetical protein
VTSYCTLLIVPTPGPFGAFQKSCDRRMPGRLLTQINSARRSTTVNVPQGCAENMRWVALQQKVPLFDRFSIGDGTT